MFNTTDWIFMTLCIVTLFRLKAHSELCSNVLIEHTPNTKATCTVWFTEGFNR